MNIDNPPHTHVAFEWSPHFDNSTDIDSVSKNLYIYQGNMFTEEVRYVDCYGNYTIAEVYEAATAITIDQEYSPM